MTQEAPGALPPMEGTPVCAHFCVPGRQAGSDQNMFKGTEAEQSQLDFQK